MSQKLPLSIENLHSLSIADRAFTQSCQAHIFEHLYLGSRSGTTNGISGNLARKKMILDDNPSFSNRVRMVALTFSHGRNGWLFNNPNFISIIQLLAKSWRQPHKLVFHGIVYSFKFDDPVLVVERLMQSFFSRTLTVLHLIRCEDVPSALFLICPGLREIRLDHVQAIEESHDKYPNGQCSGRELPTPERLDYRDSESLVKRMITLPPRFHTSDLLVKAARSDAMSTRRGRSGLFATYPRCRLQHTGGIVSH